MEDANFNPYDDFEGVKILIEKETDDMVQISRELELEVEPEEVTELLPSHNTTEWIQSAFYGWEKKAVSWDGIYSWWRCYEDCWNE